MLPLTTVSGHLRAAPGIDFQIFRPWLSHFAYLIRLAGINGKIPETDVTNLGNSILARIQRVSGLVFLVFLALHLINTYTAVLGPEAYDGYQRIARAWYQHPLVELLTIIVPLVVHVACGIIRLRRSRTPVRNLSLRRRLHRYSGVFLTIVIFGHISATRGASYFAGVFPQFEGMAFTMQWVPAYFYPYYFLFGAAAIYHAWYGVQSIVRTTSGTVIASKRTFWTVPAFGSAMIALALLAFGGLLFPVGDAMHSDYAKFVLEFFE